MKFGKELERIHILGQRTIGLGGDWTKSLAY